MDAGLDGGERQAVVEVDVGDQRDGRLLDDLGDGRGRGLVGDGDADDLGAGIAQAGDLLDRRLRVGGIGVRHRLDDDGGVAADLHVADVDGTACAARGERCRFVGHFSLVSSRPVSRLGPRPTEDDPLGLCHSKRLPPLTTRAMSR